MSRPLAAAALLCGASFHSAFAESPAEEAEPSELVASSEAEAEADADAPAELVSRSDESARRMIVNADWSGLSIRREDNRFSFETHMLLQARGTVAIPDGGDATGRAHLFRARPLFRLHLWDDTVVATVQTEWVGTPRLLDARLDIRPTDWLTVSGGQLIVPFSRAWNTPLPFVQAPERSINNDLFAPGRRFGAFAHMRPVGGYLDIWAGAFSNEVPGQPNIEGVHAPTGLVRVQVNPLGEAPSATELPSLADPAPTRLGIGAATLVSPVIGADDGSWQATTTADVGFQTHGFTAYGEGFYRASNVLANGWAAGGQVGQFVVPKHLNLFTRFSAFDDDTDDELDTRFLAEVGAGGYIHGPNLVVIARYGREFGGGVDGAHDLTLHTQVFF